MSRVRYESVSRWSYIKFPVDKPSSFPTSGLECHCGVDAKSRMSWTDENPGRKFLACYKPPEHACGAFEWLDAPVSDNAAIAMRILLKNIRVKEKDLAKYMVEEKRLKDEEKLRDDVNSRLKKAVICLGAVNVLLCGMLIIKW